MVEDRGSWLGTPTLLFFCWALLACGVRAWVAFGRKFKWINSDTGVMVAVVGFYFTHREMVKVG